MWIEKAQRCQPSIRSIRKNITTAPIYKAENSIQLAWKTVMSSFFKTSMYVLTDRKYIFPYYYILQFIFHLFLLLYLFFFLFLSFSSFPHTFPMNWISTSRSFHWTRNNFSLHQKIKPKPKCSCFDLNDPILSRLFQIQRNFKATIENRSYVSDTTVRAGFELPPYWEEHIVVFLSILNHYKYMYNFFLILKNQNRYQHNAN